MRRLKRIGFFLYSCILLGAGFYGHIQYLSFFYPGRSYERAPFGEEAPYGEEVSPVGVNPDSTGSDTELLVQTVDLNTGETQERIQRLPEKYRNMTRSQLEACIQAERNAPSLKEREEGLVYMELTAFSPDRVTLRKSYRKQQRTERFYLVLIDHKVVVYRQGEESVYMTTNIDGRLLPGGLRREILEGKRLDSREELEKFLVSYGSS